MVKVFVASGDCDGRSDCEGEEEVQKLEKKYKEGNRVRVRILGLRYLEGIATGVLKVVIVLLFNLISKR